jgi:hypothetical protein
MNTELTELLGKFDLLLRRNRLIQKNDEFMFDKSVFNNFESRGIHWLGQIDTLDLRSEMGTLLDDFYVFG